MHRTPVLAALVVVTGCGGGSAIPPRRIVVPATDRTPPSPAVRVGDVTMGREGEWPQVRLPPAADHVTSTVTGTDADGGMGRARVSFEAVFECSDPGTGRTWRVPYVRYHPPPMIERVRVAPGTAVPTILSRTARLRFDRAPCGGAEVTSVRGQTWADTTNASGLDGVSGHIRFSWQRRP
jgi:hypothetical protein